MRVFTLTLLIVGISTSGVISQPAMADQVYFDAGGGANRTSGTNPFFGSQAPGSLGLGISLGAGAFYDFQNPDQRLHVQFGFLHRYSTASDSASSGSYTLQTTYPALRIQLTRFYLTAGGTTFTWKSASSGANLPKSNSKHALIGEAGFLLPITPEIAFGVSAGLQRVSHAGSLTQVDGMAFFRFYSSPFKGIFGGSSHGSGQSYQGYRYPGGWLK